MLQSHLSPDPPLRDDGQLPSLFFSYSPPAETALAQEGRGVNNDDEYKVQCLLMRDKRSCLG